MTEEKGAQAQLDQDVTLQSRERLTVTGVSDVGSYDENCIVVYTSLGQLTVRGSELKIIKLNTDFGELIVAGRVYGLVYTDERGRGGFFGRLLK